MHKKRILLILLFVAAVILFAWLLWFLIFRSIIGPGQNVNINESNVNGTLPTLVNGNLSVIDNTNGTGSLPDFLSNALDLDAPTDVARGGLTNVQDYGDQEVDGFVTGSKGNLYYDRLTGRFFSLDGTLPVALTNTQFFNVDSIEWSKDQEKAILEYPDGTNIVYDFAQEKQITLPKELTDFSFDATGNQIAAKWYGTTQDENWLMVGDSNGSNFQLVEPMGDRGHNVQVDYSPDNQVLALVRSANSANTQNVLPIGQRGENYKEFTVSGLNYESKWSPEGNSLLYSVADSSADYTPTLWITTGSAETLGSSHLGLQLNTWAEKCAFNVSGTSVYCAEPTELPRGAGLYPELAVGVPDVFYRIDLRSGQKIPLAVPIGNQAFYSAAEVFVSADETKLFFTDAITNRLHSIRLR